MRCWRKTPSPQPTSKTCAAMAIQLVVRSRRDLVVVERTYRRDALASEDFQSPRATLLVKGREKLDFGYLDLCTDAVIHDGDGCADVLLRTGRRGPYMQKRTAKCLNLYFHARVDNGRPTAASFEQDIDMNDIGPRPLTRGDSGICRAYL